MARGVRTAAIRRGRVASLENCGLKAVKAISCAVHSNRSCVRDRAGRTFRSAGGIDMIATYLGPRLEALGFPSELLPMVAMRPLSGSGTMGLFTELVATHGPDHIISRMAATIFGSTETTFYVVTVYFGAVAIRKTRHAIAAGLIADLTGVIAAIIICRTVFG